MDRIDERITVAIRSYGRAGNVLTANTVPFAEIWVPEKQKDEYEKHYPGRVVTIPDDEDGTLQKKANAILNHAETPWILMLDDDISGIGYWERGDHFWCDEGFLKLFFVHYFEMADQLGVHLWGINQATDCMFYRTMTPFALLAPILGPFGGHLNPVLRYDENTGGKEDYDFWLQNIAKYHRTFRVNKYHYRRPAEKQRGGLSVIRTLDWELNGADYMANKWGRSVFRGIGGTVGGKAATGKNILNSNVSIPIKGC